MTAGHGLSGDIHEFLITAARHGALHRLSACARRPVGARRPRGRQGRGGRRPGGRHRDGEGAVRVAQPAARRRRTSRTSRSRRTSPSRSTTSTSTRSSRTATGALLVSARHTHAIYKIRTRDGALLWRLGGKKSRLPARVRGRSFAWQHDPRLHAGRDALALRQRRQPSGRRPRSRARSCFVSTRQRRHARSSCGATSTPAPLLSTSQGNAQLLPDGHVFVGWGSNEYFTEFDRRGRVLLDATLRRRRRRLVPRLPVRLDGRPRDRPAVAAHAEGGRTIVFASWNGATAVKRWRVLGGSDASRLASIADTAKGAFETRIPCRRVCASSRCRRSTPRAACCERPSPREQRAASSSRPAPPAGALCFRPRRLTTSVARSYTRSLSASATATRLPAGFSGVDPPPAWPPSHCRPADLDRPLDTLPGVGKTIRARLAKLGLRRRARPRGARAVPLRRRPSDLEPLRRGGRGLDRGDRRPRVEAHGSRRRLTIVEATVSDDSGQIRATWFNQPWVAEQLREGSRVRLIGTLRRGAFAVRAHEPASRTPSSCRSIPPART